MTPAERLLERLEAVRETGPGRWLARCPSHEDGRPSLSIREGDDGRVLAHCFAGCPVEEIVSAVGLELSDLFPPREKLTSNYRVDPKPPRLTNRQLEDGLHQSVSIVLRYGRLVTDCGALTDHEAGEAEAAARRVEYLFDELEERRQEARAA